jgi:hypothetical protein
LYHIVIRDGGLTFCRTPSHYRKSDTQDKETRYDNHRMSTFHLRTFGEWVSHAIE